MFNPGELPAKVTTYKEDGSFVGIKHDSEGHPRFYLPYGMDDFPTEETDAKTQLFFSLYKTFRRYAANLRAPQHANYDESIDGQKLDDHGFNFQDENGETVTLFSKIPMLEKILDIYDELRVFVILNNQSPTDKLDYSKIDRYLDKAIYLSNHSPFIDEMILPRSLVRYHISDLVRMYCYILCEVKMALDELNSLPPELLPHAQIFKEQYLYPDSVLFLEQSHNDTIRLLKDVLADIHMQVVLKDADYWYFFEAIEIFLYGGASKNTNSSSYGTWGISRFSLVWEEICLNWLFSHPSHRPLIVFAHYRKESTHRLGSQRVYIRDDFNNQLFLQHGDDRRFLLPDLINESPFAFINQTQKRYLEFSESKDKSFCTVRIKEKGKIGQDLFNRFAYFYAHRYPSMGKPSKTTESHPFRIIDSRFYQVKREFNESLYDLMGSERSYLLVDFKYVEATTYKAADLGYKAYSDLHKQLIYEAALLLNNVSKYVSSQLCIPKYFKNPTKGSVPGLTIRSELVNPKFQAHNVEIFAVDFKRVMDEYTRSIDLAE